MKKKEVSFSATIEKSGRKHFMCIHLRTYAKHKNTKNKKKRGENVLDFSREIVRVTTISCNYTRISMVKKTLLDMQENF